MAGEIRYFINGQWIPKSQLPASIIEAYDAGMLGAQPRRDPETGRALRTPEGEIDYEAIPMSDLGGGSGTDTLAGGGGFDRLTSEDKRAIAEVEGHFGMPPGTLLAAMHYETIGTLNPDIVGGRGNDYQGLIQFGSNERRAYGFRPGMTIAEQVRGPVFNYLEDRGLPYGADIKTVYRTINGGNPRAALWKNDGNGTIAQHVERIRGSVLPQAQAVMTNNGLPPEGSPALGSRLAAELEVPPSYPTAQETASLLRERGYTGPDAIARFQADNMGMAGTGGRTGPEFFAALTNPGLATVTPPPRPAWAPDDATTVTEAPPVGLTKPIVQAARTMPQANDIDMMTMTDEAGNYLDPAATIPQPPPRPSWAGRDATTSFQKPPDIAARVAGAPAPAPDPGAPPTPRSRPVGLEADNAGAMEPTGYRRLRLGSRGEDVYGVQAQLLAAGFDPGPLDGSYGPRTARAVMEFQRAAEAERPGWVGGKVDAIAGPFTQAALFERSENPSLRSYTNRPPSVRSPDPMEVGMMLGRTMPAVRPEEYDPGGGTGRDSRPPGTAPAGPPVVRRNLAMGVPELSSGDMSMALSRRVSPMEGKPWNPWGGMGEESGWNTPLSDYSKPELAKHQTFSAMPEGAKQPAPLSPTAVIAGMGGTGSSGLGAAGTSGSGPGAGFSDSGAGPGYDDDDDAPGGYNESFSTTGWL